MICRHLASFALAILLAACEPAAIVPAGAVEAPWGAIDYCIRHPEAAPCQP